MSENDTTPPTDAVVVGVDGSDKDRTCIAYAVGVASRSGKPLLLLNAGGGGEGSAASLARGVALARESGATEVTTASPSAKADRALVEASRGAHLVVVGAGPATGLQRLLGHTALAVAMHAESAVVLIPENARITAGGPVVVGVDGSESSAAAAERAFWAASLRAVPVRAIACWYLETVDGMVVTTPDTPAWHQVEDRVRAAADGVLDPLRQAHPEISVDLTIARGPAAKVLVEQADGADLLVVGNRGNGGFRGMLLGSVALAALESATCPVMIVRHG